MHPIRRGITFSLCGLVTLLALLFFSARTFAQTLPPNQYFLNLKGSLKDNAGNALANGSYSVQYRLYDVASGPNPPIFTETQNVAVFTTQALVPGQADRKGKYAVTLGYQPSKPLYASQFVNKTLYLEIWVNSQAPPAGTPRQLIMQIPSDSVTGKSMNQVIWVTNALNHIEKSKALETAAFAYYIRQIYAAIPNAPPQFVLQSLFSAQSAFNQRYRSPRTGDFRYAMLPIDAITNMYGIMVQQPGNPVTLPIIGELLTFAAGAISLTDANNAYQQFSYELGRMSSTATFNEYQNLQMEQLYLLARQNPNVALVVNTFFGFGYKANVSDSLFAILNKNTDLKSSPNFSPLLSQIEADGTMLSTLDTTIANIADFYDRMTTATKTMTTAIGQITQLQKSDYAGAASVPGTGAAVQGYFNTALNSLNSAKTLTAMNASNYINGVVLLSDATYSKYELAVAQLNATVATVNTAVATASLIAACTPDPVPPLGVATPDPSEIVAAGAEVTVASLELSSSLLDLRAAKGEFGLSPDDVLKDGLTQIGDQIANVQKQIDQRTAIIDQHIVDLYNQMNANFAALNAALSQGLTAISNALDKMQNDILTVQYTLDRLTQSFSTFATQSQRATLLVPNLTVINSWGAIPPPPPPDTNYFNQQFNAAVTYATSTALTNAENGNLGQDGYSSLYGDTDILNQLDDNNEKNLNYLMAFIYNRFYLRPSPEDFNTYTQPLFNFLFSPRLANPTAWEMSSLGMMRAATIYPDLGKPYVQASNSSFAAAYNYGKNIQDAATNMTLQQRLVNGSFVTEKSPVFSNMLRHQNLMATKLYNEIVNAETNGYPDHYPENSSQAARTKFVLDELNRNGSPLNLRAKALDGSHRLLEQMCDFGLSRSTKANDLLSSSLYSSGVSTFRDPNGFLAADPNAQRLPDGSLVKALYNSWVSSIPTAPSAPSVTVVSGSSTLAVGTYYVVVTYTITPVAGAGSESSLSTETAVTIAAGQQLLVTSPSVAGGLKYKVYVGSTSGGSYFLQNGTGTNLGTSYTISTPIVTNLSNPPATQYNQYMISDPKAVFQAAQTTRSARLFQLIDGAYVQNTPNVGGTTYVNGILDNIVADANRNRTYVGEQVATLDAILSRLSFFLIPTVNGTVKGVYNANLPAYMQSKSLANAAISMQFSGISNFFTAPVLLDSTGRYTVYVPRDEYQVLVKADSFLQRKVQVPGNTEGYVNTKTGTTLNANTALYVGDVTGHNQVNNDDQIFLRNAFNSTLSSTTWSFFADLNGDGMVDSTDRTLIQGLLSATPASANWNPRYDLNNDGVISNADLTLFDTLLTSSPLQVPVPAWNRAADLNFDGKVDIVDENILLNALGSIPTSGNWNARADLNGDGKVNVKDLSLLQSALGTRSSSVTYDSRYDLNYDGVVDFRDQILLQGALYTTNADPRWNALCDLNNDGKVDNTDSTILFLALGSTSSSSNWNAVADINKDGIVNYLDQELLQGKVGTTPASINYDSRFDFNGSSTIDQTDITLFQARLGSRAASTNWNSLADLNGDNVVDYLDLLMLRSNFGRQGQR